MPPPRDLRRRPGAGRLRRVRSLAAFLSATGFVVLIVSAVFAAWGPAAQAATTIVWKGHTWQVTSGGMAGVCQGDPNNVSVDGSGYLHLKIAMAGGTWTAAEMFTTDQLGFGTYQWQVDGPIDTYDKNVVLGLFPYGPAAGIGADGTNEIDIEYSRWGQATGPNGDWTDYPASGTTIGERSYSFSLGGSTLSTSRFSWSRSGITSSLFGGLTAVDGSAGLLESWSYTPPNATVNIPQQALPLGMNLWCFDAPPSDGTPVEIVIRDFQFVPEGTSPGSGGSGPGGRPGSGGGPAPGAGGGGGSQPGTGGAGTGGAGPGSGGASAGSGGASAGSGASGGRSAGSGGASGMTAGSGGASAGCDCAITITDPVTGRWGVAILLACTISVRRRTSRRHR